MKTSELLLLLLASSSTGVVVDGFSASSALHNAISSSSSSSLSVQNMGHIVPPHHGRSLQNTDTFEDYAGEECLLEDGQELDGLLGSSAPPLPAFCETKTQLRLDGLEPYVLVSAITATASFGVVTGGNVFSAPLFGNGNFGSVWEEAFRLLLLMTSTASSCLGLYALGIFSFSIMYSKAALARESQANEVYQKFFDATASYRYKGYQAFIWSLLLLVSNLFLFAVAYLPEQVQPFAALGSAPLIYSCWKDWQGIVSIASIIYTPCCQEDDVGEELDFSVAAVNDAESRRMEQNGKVSLTLDKTIGVRSSTEQAVMNRAAYDQQYR
mmetsp:Transcript_25148/g.62009  ORF Transcript_25148/g.62009 Transcript_25148/m.62009 type:complete len:326 (-) Transcript_25148:68-1045(-)